MVQESLPEKLSILKKQDKMVSACTQTEEAKKTEAAVMKENANPNSPKAPTKRVSVSGFNENSFI